MGKLRLIIIFLLATFVAQGCIGRAVKEGLGTARGASGTYAQIMALSPEKGAPVLAKYRNFELGKIEDGIGGLVPGDFMVYLPADFEDQLAKKHLPMEKGGKTLIVRGVIIHYESASTMGQVMGPFEEVIMRTELVDKDTGNILGVANCVGRTQETVNQGVKKKAEGLAKAIANWIGEYYPKAGRETTEEE
jgi:hypothetical protein